MFGLESLVNRKIRLLCLGLIAAAMLVCSPPAAQAQVTVGDDLNLHFAGEFGFNYAGNFGSSSSGHGTGFIGSGDLNGWYYDKRFLSFAVRPYYNRSQETSSVGTIFDDTGVTGSVNLFSGSRFPGSISYTKSHGSGSTYGIQGGAGLFATDSSLGAFVLNWGILMPKWPTLQVNFTDTSSSTSILGSTGDTTSGTKDLNVAAGYRWWGFDLQGTAGLSHQNTTTPFFLETASNVSESSSKYASIQGTHTLPLAGTLSLGYYHANYDFDGKDSGNDTFTAGAGINPTTKLAISGNFRVTNNLYDLLQRDFYGNTLVPVQRTSDSYYANSNATYRFFPGLSATGYVTYLRQSYNGVSDSNTAYGGGATYQNSIPFLGYFRFHFAVVDYYNNYQKNNGMGAFNLEGSLSRKLGKWETSADANYDQNVLAGGSWRTASSYTFGGNFQRKFTPTVMWYGSYRAARTALTLVSGSESHAQTVTSGWTLGPYGAAATYSQSGGTSVVTGTGVLTPTPITGLITDDYVLYNTKSLGVSASATFLRRISITGSYSRYRGETSALVNSLNEGDAEYLRLRYRVRKLVINGNYRRIHQTISASGLLPRTVNSYSIQITRYFNVF